MLEKKKKNFLFQIWHFGHWKNGNIIFDNMSKKCTFLTLIIMSVPFQTYSREHPKIPAKK